LTFEDEKLVREGKANYVLISNIKTKNLGLSYEDESHPILNILMGLNQKLERQDQKIEQQDQKIEQMDQKFQQFQFDQTKMRKWIQQNHIEKTTVEDFGKCKLCQSCDRLLKKTPKGCYCKEILICECCFALLQSQIEQYQIVTKCPFCQQILSD